MLAPVTVEGRRSPFGGEVARVPIEDRGRTEEDEVEGKVEEALEEEVEVLKVGGGREAPTRPYEVTPDGRAAATTDLDEAGLNCDRLASEVRVARDSASDVAGLGDAGALVLGGLEAPKRGTAVSRAS